MAPILRRTLLRLTIAVAAMTSVLLPTAAHAFSGGPSAAFSSSGITFTDTAVATSFTCAGFSMSGSVTTPQVALTAVTATGCSHPILGAMSFTPIGGWAMITVGSAVGGVVPVRVNGFRVRAAAANCAFTIGGNLNATFTFANQRLTPAVSSGLSIVDTPTGVLCPLLGVALGDPISVGGYWTNVPPAGSTPIGP